jgi:hypothetical protein
MALMHPWHPRVISDEEPSLAAEWPIRLWHRLLVDSRVPFGGRVLVVGCRRPEVVKALDECAFDVDGLDDQQSVVESASRLFPKFAFTFSPLDQTLPVPAQAFDLVLVQDTAAYRRDLLEPSARLATANILACLKPHGQLFFIRRMAGEVEVAAGHRRNCWTKHLACFPGVTETAVFFDPWFSRTTWNWLRGLTPRGSHLVVRHELPLELLHRETWIRCARRGYHTGRGACCPAAEASHERRPLQRAA